MKNFSHIPSTFLLQLQDYCMSLLQIASRCDVSVPL